MMNKGYNSYVKKMERKSLEPPITADVTDAQTSEVNKSISFKNL